MGKIIYKIFNRDGEILRVWSDICCCDSAVWAALALIVQDHWPHSRFLTEVVCKRERSHKVNSSYTHNHMFHVNIYIYIIAIYLYTSTVNMELNVSKQKLCLEMFGASWIWCAMQKVTSWKTDIITVSNGHVRKELCIEGTSTRKTHTHKWHQLTF